MLSLVSKRSLGGRAKGIVASLIVWTHCAVIVTCVPGWRDARRRETNSRLRPLKSLRRKSMDICSMCHCSPLLSPSGKQSATRTTAVLVMLSIAASAASPLLNRDCGSLFEVRSARGKAYQERIWLQALEATSDVRNMYSGSFAGRRRGLPTWRGVFSAPWRALACIPHPGLKCIIFRRHHPFRLAFPNAVAPGGSFLEVAMTTCRFLCCLSLPGVASTAALTFTLNALVRPSLAS